MPKHFDEIKLNFFKTAERVLERATNESFLDVYPLMGIIGEMLRFDYPEEVAYTEIPPRWEPRPDGSYAALTGESGEEIEPEVIPFVAFISLFEGADPVDPVEYLREQVAKEEGLPNLLLRFEELQKAGSLQPRVATVVPAVSVTQHLSGLIGSTSKA